MRPVVSREIEGSNPFGTANLHEALGGWHDMWLWPSLTVSRSLTLFSGDQFMGFNFWSVLVFAVLFSYLLGAAALICLIPATAYLFIAGHYVWGAIAVVCATILLYALYPFLRNVWRKF